MTRRDAAREGTLASLPPSPWLVRVACSDVSYDDASQSREPFLVPETFIPQFSPLLQLVSSRLVSTDRPTALRRRFGLGFRDNLDGAISERIRAFSPKCPRLPGP